MIIAEDVVGEALSALVVNKMRGVLDICAMKAPGFGVRRKDLLQDIAIATGATYVAQEVGVSLETVTPEMLGTCERMVIGKEETTIVTDGKQAEAMEKRIQQIRTEAENTDSQFDKEKAEERVAALGGGIARIKVGAATETELKDKKLRYEDALNAVKSALKTGILPGGGSTLAYLLRFEDEICNAIEDEDEKRGAKIVFNSLSAPVCQIAKNCGMIPASRRVEAPSRHLHESSPGEEVVGGFFSDFEAVRTEPRCSAQASRARSFCRRSSTRTSATGSTPRTSSTVIYLMRGLSIRRKLRCQLWRTARRSRDWS